MTTPDLQALIELSEVLAHDFVEWAEGRMPQSQFLFDTAANLVSLKELVQTAPTLPGAGGGDAVEQVCAEAYQVVASLLSDVGAFDTPEAVKILDNLSQQRLVHSDVLPWPSFGDGHVDQLEQDAVRYRWIRDAGGCPFNECDHAWDSPEALDAAIDAALPPQQEG